MMGAHQDRKINELSKTTRSCKICCRIPSGAKALHLLEILTSFNSFCGLCLVEAEGGECLHFSLSVFNLHGLLVPLSLFHPSSSLALWRRAVNFPSKPLGHDWRDLSRGFAPLRGLSRLPPASCYHNHQKSSFKPLSHLYLSYMCGTSHGQIDRMCVLSSLLFLPNTFTATEAKCWTIYTVYLLSDILDISLYSECVVFLI